jgi:hypothetical protein
MSVAFLFPGQGSQVPGMLHALPDHPSIERTLGQLDHVTAGGTPELVLVSRYPGIGKASVVTEFHKLLVKRSIGE